MNRIGALAGLLCVAGNVLGVAVLGNVASAYRPDALASWTMEVIEAPGSAAASAIGFTLGLVALAGWALVVGHRLGTAGARAGGATIAAGALLNAAGTPAPIVVGSLLGASCTDEAGCVAAGSALLGLSLALDALFNLLFGIGLVLIGLAFSRHVGLRSLTALTVGAGLATLPVSLQVFSARAADLLVLAGPLWLAAVLLTSVWLWREA